MDIRELPTQSDHVSLVCRIILTGRLKLWKYNDPDDGLGRAQDAPLSESFSDSLSYYMPRLLATSSAARAILYDLLCNWPNRTAKDG